MNKNSKDIFKRLKIAKAFLDKEEYKPNEEDLQFLKKYGL